MGRTDRGKTVYPPAPSGSGVIIKTETTGGNEKSTPAEPSLPSVPGLETEILSEQSERVEDVTEISKIDESNSNSSPPTKKIENCHYE